MKRTIALVIGKSESSAAGAAEKQSAVSGIGRKTSCHYPNATHCVLTLICIDLKISKKIKLVKQTEERLIIRIPQQI